MERNKKGRIPWNKGIKLSKEQKEKMNFLGLQKGRVWNKHSFKTGKKHPLWKGDNAGLTAKHKWIDRRIGQPSICYNCGTEVAKRYEWANITGEYKRDVNDYVRLCKKCHLYFDMVTEKKLKKVGGGALVAQTA